MAKVSREELEEILQEEDAIKSDIFAYEEVQYWDKNEDFTLVETTVDNLPEGVTVNHSWLEDE